MPAAEERSIFLGAQSSYTIDPKFYVPKVDDLPALVPCYRLMDDEGVPLPGATLPELSESVNWNSRCSASFSVRALAASVMRASRRAIDARAHL